MNKKEKTQFIKNLLGSITEELLAKVPEIPKEWDGHELRRLIVEKVQNDVRVYKLPRKRVKAYNAAVYERNLI